MSGTFLFPLSLNGTYENQSHRIIATFAVEEPFIGIKEKVVAVIHGATNNYESVVDAHGDFEDDFEIASRVFVEIGR